MGVCGNEVTKGIISVEMCSHEFFLKHAPGTFILVSDSGHILVCMLITICAVVISKCAVEKGNVCTKMCRYSGQNDDFCSD